MIFRAFILLALLTSRPNLMAESLKEHFRDALALPFRGTIPQWGREFFKLGPPLTKSGLFDVSTSRQLIQPFASFQDDRVREVNLLAPVRGAKTLYADVCHGWLIKNQAGPVLFLFQDDKAAKDQAELRTWPNIERCQQLSDMLSDDRHKNRTLDIIFPHMPFHIRGPADSNLQSRGYQYVFLDEPWQYKEGKMEEAKGRLGDFVKMGTDKLVCLSQGGYAGSEWDRHFSQGVLHEWHVQCLSCAHYMLPIWTGHRSDGTTWGMKWDRHKSANGQWDIVKCLPSVHFECEKCSHKHFWNARTKAEWNRTGKYICETGDGKINTKISYHWTAVIDYPWDQLVDLYLQAVNAWKVGTVEPLVKFFQKRMAEMASEERLLENRLNFSKAVYEINSKPDDATQIMTVDRQEEDVYWVLCCYWFRNRQTETSPLVRRALFKKCFSAAEIEQLRIDRGIERRHVLIDSGYRPKGDHGVYSYCIQYGWIPVKGVATEGGEEVTFTHNDGEGARVVRSYSEPVLVDAESGTGQERLTQMVKFSSPTYADRVQNLIEHGLWQEPESANNADPLEKEYKTQMSAEFKRAINVGNKHAKKTKHIWVCPSKNNHAFDDAKIQVLAGIILEFLPDSEVLEEKKAA